MPARRLIITARGEPWSPATHHHWPQAFKAWVRTLLLVWRRCVARGGEAARGGGKTRAARRTAAAAESAVQLARLPLELVLKVAEQAAKPMSAWLEAEKAG